MDGIKTWLITESAWLSPLGTIVAILVAVVSTVAVIVTFGSKQLLSDNKEQLDQDKEELRLELLRAEIRLKHVDPERFLDEIT